MAGGFVFLAMLIYRENGLQVTRNPDAHTGNPVYVFTIPLQHSTTHLTPHQAQELLAALAADVADQFGVHVSQVIQAVQRATLADAVVVAGEIIKKRRRRKSK